MRRMRRIRRTMNTKNPKIHKMRMIYPRTMNRRGPASTIFQGPRMERQ
jgi:hypothetical protein